MFDLITSISTYMRMGENLKNGDYLEFIPLFILIIFILFNEIRKKLHPKD